MNEKTSVHTGSSRKRPVSLSVSSALMDEARSLGLNASRAAEVGIELAVKCIKEEAWLVENARAIQAHSDRVAQHGMLITPPWLAR
jgi:antitoxin CcdA